MSPSAKPHSAEKGQRPPVLKCVPRVPRGHTWIDCGFRGPTEGLRAVPQADSVQACTRPNSGRPCEVLASSRPQPYLSLKKPTWALTTVSARAYWLALTVLQASGFFCRARIDRPGARLGIPVGSARHEAPTDTVACQEPGVGETPGDAGYSLKMTAHGGRQEH